MAEAAVITEEPGVDTPPPVTPSSSDDNGAPAVVMEEEDDCATTGKSQATPSAPVTPPKVDLDLTAEAKDTSVAGDQIKENPANKAAASGPLPSIEECLFGMPRDLDNKADAEDDSFFLVPLNLLRRVSSQGIDDDDERAGSHRGLTWRLLLGFLPADRREWDAVAQKQRLSYHTFVQELFCIEDRDVDGSELRGHHSKRYSDRGMTKAEKRERRRISQQKKKEEEEKGKDGPPRSPIKFVDETQSPEEGEKISSASISEDETTDSDEDITGDEENITKKSETDATISQLLQDDPAQWNMSVREQKILERLTNHDAVNQLLVKRDCKEWNNFLENATLLDEIRKDVNRTHPHLYFYLEPNDRLGARRYAALERILFVWAKLNKGVSLPLLSIFCCAAVENKNFIRIVYSGD